MVVIILPKTKVWAITNNRESYQVPLLCKERIIHVDVNLIDVPVPSLFTVKSFLLQCHLYLKQYQQITQVQTLIPFFSNSLPGIQILFENNLDVQAHACFL